VNRTSRALLLGPLAFAGAVTGHVLGYLVSHPEAHERSAALLSAGHGSFGRLVTGAAAAGAAALVVLAVRAGRREAIRFRWLAARLVPLQIAIFALLELAERGFDPQRTFGDPAVFVGLAAQILVALGAALLARGVEDVVRSFRSLALPRQRAPARSPLPRRASILRARSGKRWDALRRAPPLSVGA
jgi:hypothetical protein